MFRRIAWPCLLVLVCAGCSGQAGRSWSLKPSPVGEAWTILCLEASDSQHRTNAERLAEGLRNRRELDRRAVRVVHEAAVSRIYYGTYHQFQDKRSDQLRLEPRCSKDCRFLRSLAVSRVYPFLLARPVPMPGASGDPPEWDLRGARGVYSLQICYCIDKAGFPDRREGAVAIVRQLRREGEEAYYYHGPVKSLVCVSRFDESAVIEDGSGRRQYSQEVIKLQNRREDFKYNTEWLQKLYRVLPNGRREAQPSFLVRIPHQAESLE
jgi:hypothetical protein